MAIISEISRVIQEFKKQNFSRRDSYPCIDVTSADGFLIYQIFQRTSQFIKFEDFWFWFSSSENCTIYSRKKDLTGKIDPQLLEKLEKISIAYLKNLSLDWTPLSYLDLQKQQMDSITWNLINSKIKESSEFVIYFKKGDLRCTVIIEELDKTFLRQGIYRLSDTEGDYLVGKKENVLALIDEIRQATTTATQEPAEDFTTLASHLNLPKKEK